MQAKSDYGSFSMDELEAVIVAGCLGPAGGQRGEDRRPLSEARVPDSAESRCDGPGKLGPAPMWVASPAAAGVRRSPVAALEGGAARTGLDGETTSGLWQHSLQFDRAGGVTQVS